MQRLALFRLRGGSGNYQERQGDSSVKLTPPADTDPPVLRNFTKVPIKKAPFQELNEKKNAINKNQEATINTTYMSGFISKFSTTATSQAQAVTSTASTSLMSFIPAITSLVTKEKEEPKTSETQQETISVQEDENLFLLDRLEKQSKAINQTAEWLGSQFAASYRAAKKMMQNEDEEFDKFEVDWEFWGSIINDYENVVRSNPKRFKRKLHQGIPEAVRGM